MSVRTFSALLLFRCMDATFDVSDCIEVLWQLRAIRRDQSAL
jgi:hypothetical protein